MLILIHSLRHFVFQNTYILKRKYPAPLTKLGKYPRKLRGKHYIYDLVEDLNAKPSEKVTVILTHYVEGCYFV